jgi:hypothetical protein
LVFYDLDGYLFLLLMVQCPDHFSEGPSPQKGKHLVFIGNRITYADLGISFVVSKIADAVDPPVSDE